VSNEDLDAGLGAGIKLLDWSGNGTLLAIGDYSRRVVVLSAPGLSEFMSLLHPAAVKPAESLQVRPTQYVCSTS